MRTAARYIFNTATGALALAVIGAVIVLELILNNDPKWAPRIYLAVAAVGIVAIGVLAV